MKSEPAKETAAEKEGAEKKQAQAESTTESAKKESQEQAKSKEGDDHEQRAEFKTHRKFMFAFGKFLKYTSWAALGLFFYHFYLVMYKDKPEEGLGANDTFLNLAMSARMAYVDLVDLLTKPPVNSLLMERPPLPPGYQPMKTLVLNVSGTLTHSEYKVSDCPFLLVSLSKICLNCLSMC